MRKFGWLLVVAVAATGCKKSETGEPEAERGRATPADAGSAKTAPTSKDDLRGDPVIPRLRDMACACKDKACAEEMNRAFDKAIEGITTEAQLEAAAPAIGEAAACLAKLGITAE